MAASLPAAAVLTPREKLEAIRLQPAKALMNRETPEALRRKPGLALARAIAEAGYSIKEAAAHLNRDAAQVSRWIAGTERVQIDALYAVPRLFAPFVVALAQDAEGVDVVTTITVRRLS